MIKIFEALIIFLSGHLLSDPKEASVMTGVDLILSKSRFIAIFFVAAITVPLMLAGGIMLTLIGTSHWLGEADPSNVFRLYVYFGSGLTILSVGAMAFGLSKKRFEIPEKKPELPAPIHANSIIEQVVVNVIKEFIKDIKPSSTAASKPQAFVKHA
jgi:hypothetical protein